jgi:hypothetical protein
MDFQAVANRWFSDWWFALTTKVNATSLDVNAT